MKVKLKTELVKKFQFPVGGDMSESIGVAVSHQGQPISYQEFCEVGGTVKPFHALELEEEFLVVDHQNPVPKYEYEKFEQFFTPLNEDQGKSKGLTELIEAIFLKYQGSSDFHCEHDVFMYYGLDDEKIENMDKEDIERLDKLGFFLSDSDGERHFRSFKYGSC